MEQYAIKGGNPLVGEVEIGGAKNAALAILAASIMTDETVLIENMPDSPYIYINRQGNLFTGFDTSPQVSINWKSSKQVIPIFKHFGVNVSVIDKDTKKDKDSILVNSVEVIG